MTLAYLLQRQARGAPDRPAIFEGSRVWATHAQWAARSAGLAQRLGEAGLVVVPVNAKLHPAEAEWIIDNAQARCAFVTRDVAPKTLAGLERQVDAESVEAD